MPRVAVSAAVLGAFLGLTASGPPEAPKRPVTDAYHGVAVRDDYRWLEDAADPAVRAWSDGQNAWARSILDALPDREAIARRVQELEAAPTPSYWGLAFRGGRLFAIKSQPPKQQPMLIAMRSADDPSSERVLVDPNALDPKGGISIDWYVPSRDGELLAVSLSEGGSESGSVWVFDAQSGRKLPDLIPRVNRGTAGGGLAWNADATGFFYTRYPREQERPAADLDFYQQVFFHRLGTPNEQDTYALGKDFPRIAETELRSSEDGRYVLAAVRNGDGRDPAFFLAGPDGAWSRIAAESDAIGQAVFGPDGALYLLSHANAPRGKVLRMPLETPTLEKAQVVVPEGDGAFSHLAVTASRLWIAELLGGPSRLRVFDHTGKLEREIKILAISSVGQLVPPSGDELLFSNQSYLVPAAWYRTGPGGQIARTGLAKRSPADFQDTQVDRVSVVSKDGTRVPLTLLVRKGAKRDGMRPTLLTGYGGYGISQTPGFSAQRRVWLEQGGVWAIAGLRGGGEFGETWHRAGNLTRKQNVFDDFLACAGHLVDSDWTRSERLAIEGGSNGGLLMGAALTQRPDLFRAVVSHVGIYDMLRWERFSNGAFNVTEFGTVEDLEQFRALHAYSPYHRVKDNVRYPGVLMMTGANDPRVDPAQSRKMTARLQAATASSNPILLRTSATSGHGIGTALNEAVAQHVDVFSFLFWQLGVKYRPVAQAPAPGR